MRVDSLLANLTALGSDILSPFARRSRQRRGAPTLEPSNPDLAGYANEMRPFELEEESGDLSPFTTAVETACPVSEV